MSDRVVPLAGARLTGLPSALPGRSAMADVVASLRHHARALGAHEPCAAAPTVAGGLGFELAIPELGTVACRVAGWPDGDLPASETVAQAACGLASVHGRALGAARPLGLPYLSTLTASLALQGSCAVMLARARGASLSRAETSLAQAGLLAAGQYIAGATVAEPAERCVPGATTAHERPPFLSADGIAVELESLEAGPWRAFWTGLGVDLDTTGRGWQAFMPRYANAVAPLPRPLFAALAALPYAQILARCEDAGMACCAVRRLDQRARDADLADALRDGPWRFARGPACPPPAGPPAGSAPLAGITVIESCRRIQGPLAGHLLAMLGANVIRIEPPGGDPLRDMPPLADGVSARFQALNRLKTVVEIDLKSLQGQQSVRQIVREADVFLHNWAPGKAEAFGLDAARLGAVRPGLVHAYAGGWGPREDIGLPGTDFMVQAYSGVADCIGRAARMRGGSLFTVLDVLGGVMASQGVVGALLARHLHGHGVAVESSLLGAATSLCVAPLRALWHDCRRPDDVPPIDALFATRDGKLALTCDGPAALAAAARLLGIAPARLAAALPAALLDGDAHTWQARFQAQGIAASHVPDRLDSLHRDPRLATNLTLGSYTRVDTPWRFA